MEELREEEDEGGRLSFFFFPGKKRWTVLSWRKHSAQTQLYRWGEEATNATWGATTTYVSMVGFSPSCIHDDIHVQYYFIYYINSTSFHKKLHVNDDEKTKWDQVGLKRPPAGQKLTLHLRNRGTSKPFTAQRASFDQQVTLWIKIVTCKHDVTTQSVHSADS